MDDEHHKSDKTKTYNEWERTRMYSPTNNINQPPKFVELGGELLLNGKVYHIQGEVSTHTGEATIYEVTDSEGKRKALKLYHPFNHWREEPNVETLKRIKGIVHPHILRLYDFAAGAEGEKFKGRHCFEVSDFATGGDLLQVADWKNKYTPDFIRKIIIPQLLKGIKTLHHHRIIHTDLKPANILYTSSSQDHILIGDYGSSKTFEEGEADSRITTTLKSTQFYMPSEQGIGQLSPKNDYFAFGMLLLHLLYPEQVGAEADFGRIDRQKEKRIRERLYEGHPPVLYDSSPSHAPLNRLISGLTQDHHSIRWGEHEVVDFLSGKKVELQKITKLNPLALDLGSEGVLRSNEDFVAFVGGDSWEELFVSNVEMRTKILAFIRDTNSQDTAKEVQRLFRLFKTQEPALGKRISLALMRAAITRRLLPTTGISLGGKAFFKREISTEQGLWVETARYIGTLLNAKNITVGEFVKYIYLLEFQLSIEPLGKTLLETFWKKTKVGKPVPQNFDLGSPLAFIKKEAQSPTLLANFIFDGQKDKMDWKLEFKSYEGYVVNYTLEPSLDIWLQRHKIPLVHVSKKSKYAVSHEVIPTLPYSEYRKENYKALLKKIAEKHNINHKQLRPVDVNVSVDFINDFISQNEIVWAKFGDAYKELRLHYDDSMPPKTKGGQGNVFQYEFRIHESLAGFAETQGFPYPEGLQPKDVGGFRLIYQEEYPWQNFSTLEWALTQAIEQDPEIPKSSRDVPPLEDALVTSNQVIVTNNELDKIEQHYLYYHGEWRKKLRIRYAAVLTVALVVFLAVVFIKPLMNGLWAGLIYLSDFLKWGVSITLFIALVYGLSVYMKND